MEQGLCASRGRDWASSTEHDGPSGLRAWVGRAWSRRVLIARVAMAFGSRKFSNQRGTTHPGIHSAVDASG